MKKVLFASLLTALTLCACGEDKKDTADVDACSTSGDVQYVCNNDKAQQRVCKDVDGDLVWTDGDVETCKNGCENGKCKAATACDTTACPNGCKDDGSCKAACDTTACPNGCKDDGSCKAACDTTACPNGCNDDGSCKSKDIVTNCSADADCGDASKVCENGSCIIACKDNSSCAGKKVCEAGHCVEPPCAADTDCSDGMMCENKACVPGNCTENVCETDGKNIVKCVHGRAQAASACEGKCLEGDCRADDWCSKAEHCAGREDGATTCKTSENVCLTFACANANCAADTTCVLGACVPKAQVNDSREICDVDKFVPFCEVAEISGKKVERLVDCTLYDKDEAGNKTYKVSRSACNGACRAYKDGTAGVKSACVELADKCGGAVTVTECDEEADQGWLTTYTCGVSTNAEKISYISKFDMCDEGYGCYGNACE